MISLCIDIGNTRIKAAVFKDGTLQNTFHFENMEGLQWYCNEVEKSIPVIISNVTNADTTPFYDRFNTLILLNHHTKLPIRNLYKTPETLGNDRLASVIAAWSLYPNQNNLVIDAGTCVKYDFVNFRGEYSGGSISPGLDIRFRSLNDFTGRLPLISKKLKYSPLGQSTDEAILSGVMYGLQSEMQGFIDHYEKDHKGLNIIMTGGDASYFSDKLKGTIFADSNLVLKGLYHILKHNAPEV
ncbi:MAG: type III pantothenate kinase [Flavobacteriales bacterium]|nr:type III pantothenate kinase [Flavobacteriales bacterium]